MNDGRNAVDDTPYPPSESDFYLDFIDTDDDQDANIHKILSEVLAELHVRLQNDVKSENETTKVWDSGYREALHDVLELFDETVANNGAIPISSDEAYCGDA